MTNKPKDNRWHCSDCRYAVAGWTDDGKSAMLFCANERINGKPNLVFPVEQNNGDFVPCADARQQQFMTSRSAFCAGYAPSSALRWHKIEEFFSKERNAHTDKMDKYIANIEN